MLAIDAVERIEPEDVTESDARRAGMTRDEILAMLAAKADGECYRVRLHVAGEDPRIALREDAALDEATVAALRARLDRLDAASSWGPWTRPTLRLIAERPSSARPTWPPPWVATPRRSRTTCASSRRWASRSATTPATSSRRAAVRCWIGSDPTYASRRSQGH